MMELNYRFEIVVFVDHLMLERLNGAKHLHADNAIDEEE